MMSAIQSGNTVLVTPYPPDHRSCKEDAMAKVILPYPTVEYVREHFSYDESTGLFTRRKKSKFGKKPIGSVAGFVGSYGYWVLSISGRQFHAHRLAWMHYYGVLPKHEIDHINGIRTDNRIANLREASDLQNGANRGLNKNNTSGIRGVHWDKYAGKWRADIKFCGKKRNLGNYDCLIDAVAARIKAESEFFGEFSGRHRH